MSKTLEKKKQVVGDVVEKLKNTGDKPETTSAIIFNYSKIEANEINDLRTKLEQKGASIKIVKNTLIKRVLDTLGSKMEKKLKGQNAILIPSNTDLISPLKELYKFINEKKKGNVVFGILNNDLIPVSKIEQLSNLPSRKELLGQFVGALSSPIRNFAYTLNDTQTKFVKTLQAIKDSKVSDN